MEKVLNNGLCEMSQNEMLGLDGGFDVGSAVFISASVTDGAVVAADGLSVTEGASAADSVADSVATAD